MLRKIVKSLSLVTLMGIPGSGKSTLADAIKASFEDRRETLCVILRYDDFIPLEVQQQKQYLGNNQFSKTLRKNFVQCVQWLASSMLNCENNKLELESTTLSLDANGLIGVKDFVDKIEDIFAPLKDKQGDFSEGFLIIDDNNYYRSMRNEFYQIAKKLECSFCVLYLNCSLNDAIQRNSERSPQFRIPTEAIEEMSKKLEEPNPMENACDLFCVQVNPSYNSAGPSTSSSSTDVDASVKVLLQHSLLNPVIYTPPPDRSQDRRVCSENEIHQADLVLRKWVSSRLTISSFTTNFNSSQNRQAQSQELRLKKSLVLDKLRSGELRVTAQVHEDVEFRDEIINLMSSMQIPDATERLDGVTS